MQKSIPSAEKIIGIRREARGGMQVKAVCVRHNICALTCYGWERKLKRRYRKPRSLWDNGCIESCHGRLRDECLNRAVLGSLAESRVVIEQRRGVV